MHDSMMRFVSDVLAPWLQDRAWADLGSRNVNGAVKDAVHHVTGFDIAPGSGVDVILHDGIVPEAYYFRFDVLTCLNVLSYSSPSLLLSEVDMLLRKGGLFVTSACTEVCRREHSMPVTFVGTIEKMRELLNNDFEEIVLFTLHGSHDDLIYIGRKR